MQMIVLNKIAVIQKYKKIVNFTMFNFSHFATKLLNFTNCCGIFSYSDIFLKIFLIIQECFVYISGINVAVVLFVV
jgi:hypothetical protein